MKSTFQGLRSNIETDFGCDASQNYLRYQLETHYGYSLEITKSGAITTIKMIAKDGTILGQGTIDISAGTALVSAELVNQKIIMHISDGSTVECDLASLYGEINAKYTKPTTGIPKTDLSSDVQAILEKADTLIVHLSYDSETEEYSIDKTYAQVLEAVNANRHVLITDAIDGFSGYNYFYRLSMVVTTQEPNYMHFTCLEENYSDYVNVYEDDTVESDYTEFFVLPEDGITEDELSDSVNASLALADSAYQKPATGIPSTDMTTAVQGSLTKADNAVEFTVQTLTEEQKAQARANIGVISDYNIIVNGVLGTDTTEPTDPTISGGTVTLDKTFNEILSYVTAGKNVYLKLTDSVDTATTIYATLSNITKRSGNIVGFTFSNFDTLGGIGRSTAHLSVIVSSTVSAYMIRAHKRIKTVITKTNDTYTSSISYANLSEIKYAAEECSDYELYAEYTLPDQRTLLCPLVFANSDTTNDDIIFTGTYQYSSNSTMAAMGVYEDRAVTIKISKDGSNTLVTVRDDLMEKCFVVTLSENQGTYSVDKTYVDILLAYMSDGTQVVLYASDMGYIPLSAMGEDDLQFTVSHYGTVSPYTHPAFSGYTVIVKDDETVTVNQHTIITTAILPDLTDNTPTSGSTKLISSGGVYTALSNYSTTAQMNTAIANHHDNTKQDTLVSGTNIKTVNGQNILGSGDLAAGLIDDVTINNVSIVESKIAKIIYETGLGSDSNNAATVTAIRAFVNSSIEAVAAYYITSDTAGNAFATKSALDAGPWYYAGQLRTPTRNDYAIVIADETHSGQTARYTYVKADGATTGYWNFQYTFNMTFTQAQINAINSGITSAKVALYDAHLANTNNPHSVSKTQVGLSNVVNTGDSSTPVENGTDKFTTGGAYTELNKKVDKVTGKSLSTNDYTNADKQAVDNIGNSISSAINALDKTVTGANAAKTLATLTETNGIINATFQDIAINQSQVNQNAGDEIILYCGTSTVNIS